MNTVSARQVIVDPGRTALLIIDMQNDFVLPDAELSTPRAMDLIPTIAGFAHACRERGFPVIYTREMHRPGLEDFGIEGCFEPPHCLEGTDGPDIVAGLEPQAGDFVISAKRRYDAFFGTELEVLLRGLRIDNLIFSGVCTDICVLSSVLTARNMDYRCYVLRDAVDATSPQRQEAALMCMSHVFAYVGDTAEAAGQFGLGLRRGEPSRLTSAQS
ncbi:cysteine hydrolase [Mycobacterium sp. 21AC1]|uniref:cysteine hydrolase family protein n=1 Tax=[Mycobacterium] appelbergii TaxID=2939269 RepID=UPI002938DAFC|nr:isochorismatase family cysteine hydrolase [Mycobacterium sp. 21AC1]MDV3123611.1 cysteine hydrolase [Mycobacterium sp. 21AC1]